MGRKKKKPEFWRLIGAQQTDSLETLRPAENFSGWRVREERKPGGGNRNRSTARSRACRIDKGRSSREGDDERRKKARGSIKTEIHGGWRVTFVRRLPIQVGERIKGRV